MMIAIWFLILVVSLFLLVKSADYFTEYAERLGKILKLPNFIIGVMIVAVGTSLPELATSIMGVHQGDAEFLSGNVLGTIIVNILLGFGIAVLVSKKKATFSWDIIANDMPFFATGIFLVIICLWDGKFTFFEALLFLLCYLVYIFYIYFIQKEHKLEAEKKVGKELESEIKQDLKESADLEKDFNKTKKSGFSVKLFFLLLVSLGVVLISSNYVVEAVMNLAGLLGLGSSVLAATVVALGTSLPEIFVAISAAKRGNFDMVIGDILGSNIFDIFVIYGVVGMYTTLTISTHLFGILASFLVGAFFLLWLILIDKKITKTEAMLFVIIYVLFVGKLFNLF